MLVVGMSIPSRERLHYSQSTYIKKKKKIFLLLIKKELILDYLECLIIIYTIFIHLLITFMIDIALLRNFSVQYYMAQNYKLYMSKL